MVDARRTALARRAPRPVSHAGLELDRYVEKIESGGEKLEQRHLFARLAGAAPPPLYAKAYRRWRAALDGPDSCAEEAACSREGLLVGMGAESVLETALTLHHAYGTPLIPGSALKGLARHYFDQVVMPGDSPLGNDHRAVLFGSADAAGYVTYHDAWYVPGSAPDDRPLKVDVLTPHHPSYNAGSSGKRTAPTDFDDPNPVPFLHARGSYLIAVRGPNPGCAEFAQALLLQALADYGVGGKTTSGYGRLTLKGAKAAPTPQPPAVAPAPPAVAPASPPPPLNSALLRQVEGLAAGQVYTQIGRLGMQWARLPKGPEREQVGRALFQRMRDANLLNNFNFEDQQWVMTLKNETKLGE